VTKADAVTTLKALRAASMGALKKRLMYSRRDYHERRVAALTVALQEMGAEDAAT
jgi:hypothetical protein